MKFSAEVKELPEHNVAYIRHIGPYNQIGQAIQRIFEWAGPKGLIQFPKTQCMAVYYDNPEQVAESELKSDACLTVPEGTPEDGDVKIMKIPGGKFAVAHVEIDPSEYGEAWDKLLGEWIPEQELKLDPSRLCYEWYMNDPEQHPEKKHVVDICEPIVSA